MQLRYDGYMKRIEMSNGAQDPITTEVTPLPEEKFTSELSGSLEEMKDQLFNDFMKFQLLREFADGLSEYVNPAELDEMIGALEQASPSEQIAALSLPHELRERMFERITTSMDQGKTPAEAIQAYIQTIAPYGFTFGFHTSPHDIRPDEDGRWHIKGTEADHRDDDRMMAYFSTQYRHLFKKRHPKFIYIVRVDPDTIKTDGNWSRVDSLSVVARVPFETVVQYVESTIKEKTSPRESGEVC